MVVDYSVLPAFLVSALVVILSPGADSFLLLRSTLRGGKRDGLLTMAGIFTGVAVLSILLISGVGLVIARVPGLLFWLKIVGSLYLLYLAVQSFRAGLSLAKKFAAEKLTATETELPVSKKKAGPFVLGFLTNVTNPKVLIFFLAFFPQFLGQSGNIALQLLMLLAFFVTCAILWLVFLLYTASAMKRVMTTPGFTVGMEFVVAIVFAILAVTLLVSGLSLHA